MDNERINKFRDTLMEYLKNKNISKAEWELIARYIEQQYELECSKITLKNLTTSE